MIQIHCCEKRPAPLNCAWNNLPRPETVPAQLTTTDQHSVSTDPFCYIAVLSRRRGHFKLAASPPSVSEDRRQTFGGVAMGTRLLFRKRLIATVAVCLLGLLRATAADDPTLTKEQIKE